MKNMSECMLLQSGFEEQVDASKWYDAMKQMEIITTPSVGTLHNGLDSSLEAFGSVFESRSWISVRARPNKIPAIELKGKQS